MGKLSDTKKYTISSGKVLFCPAGEEGSDGQPKYRDLGNAPSLGLNLIIEKKEHRQSRSGLKTRDKVAIVSLDGSGKFTLDEPRIDNLELFFASLTPVSSSQGAAVAQTINLELRVGKWAKLGFRDVTITEVLSADGSTIYVEDVDVEFDEKAGAIYVPATGSGVTDGEICAITYSRAAKVVKQVNAGTKTVSRVGHFAYFGDPPVGKIEEVYGYGTLSGDGDYPLISEDWKTMNFTIDFESNVAYDGIPEIIDCGDV